MLNKNELSSIGETNMPTQNGMNENTQFDKTSIKNVTEIRERKRTNENMKLPLVCGFLRIIFGLNCWKICVLHAAHIFQPDIEHIYKIKRVNYRFI